MVENKMEKAKFLWSKTNRWHRGLLLFIIIELNILPGGKVGFTCKDPALSHPFTGDTITAKHLFGTIILLPLAVLLLVERANNTDKRLALRWYKEYLYGMLLNLIIVESLKVAVGSPRPHFFDTCGPKEADTCQGSEYVTSYSCTKRHWLTQSNTSFPSGHTALAAHAGLFLIYYLHKRAVRSGLVLACQITVSVLSILCGLSRMWDHRHHWWDVLSGAVVGLPIVLYTIVYLCNNFASPDDKELLNASENGNSNNIDAKETLKN